MIMVGMVLCKSAIPRIKDVFVGFFKKALSILDSMSDSGLTFATFRPCCTPN